MYCFFKSINLKVAAASYFFFLIFFSDNNFNEKTIHLYTITGYNLNNYQYTSFLCLYFFFILYSRDKRIKKK